MEEDKNSNQEEYSLYNYFYKHPSILLASITAIATVFSLTANFVYYNLELHYLEYWGFPTNHFHFSLAGNASTIVLGILLFIVFIPIRALYSSFVSVFQNNHLCVKRQRYKTKAIMKKYKESKKGIKTIEKADQCIISDEEMRSGIKNLKKDVRKLWWLVMKQFLPFYFATVVLAWLVFSLYSSLSSVFISQSLLVFLIIFLSVLAYFLILLGTFRLLHNSDYKKAKNEIMSVFPIIDSEETKARYTIKRYGDFKIHELLSNRIIINGLLSFCIGFVVFILSFVVLIDRGYKNQKSFQIAEMNNKQFVVIYKDAESYYLNESEINDEVITISDVKHIIFQTDYLEIRSETFKQVEKGVLSRTEQSGTFICSDSGLSEDTALESISTI